MQPDVAGAQIATLREWADLWADGAKPGSGAFEVAFLLRRAARVADASLDGQPMPPEPEAPPAAVVMEDAREG